jgi:hypothetical protein
MSSDACAFGSVCSDESDGSIDKNMIETLLSGFPWNFALWDSVSDEDSDGEMYEDTDDRSPKLTTREEIERWILGMVPYCYPETLRRELKVFHIITSISTSNLDEDSLRRMFETSDFSDLAPHSLDRLRLMMKYYVPKYFTSFANSNYIDKAEFIIGLTDDGEVNGAIVPIELTDEDVFEMVWNEVSNVICSQSPEFGGTDAVNHYLHYVKQNLRVELVEMDPKLSMLDDWSDDFLRDHSAKIRNYERERQLYLTEMHKLTRAITYYRRSVEDMINDPSVHDEFIEFIMTHDPSAEDEDVIGISDLTIELRRELVNRVRNVATVPITYNPGQFLNERNDVRNMAYWITRIRDMRVIELCSLKPNPLVRLRPSPLYTSLMIRNPVQRIISNLPLNMKVVIIQIIFPGRLSIPFPPGCRYHKSMTYIDLNGELRTSARYVNSNGPSCI